MKKNFITKFAENLHVAKFFEKWTDTSFTEFIGDWKWIFKFSFKYKWIVLFYTILGLFSSTFSIGSSYVGRILINIITEKKMEQLPFLIGVMAFMLVFSLVFSSVMSRVNAQISIYVNNEIQSTIFDSIINVKWKELNKYKNGDLLNRFNADVGTISGNAISWIPNIVINIYSFIVTFIVVYKMDHTMAWFAVLSAPFLLLMSRVILRKQRMYRKKVMALNSDMMSFEVDSFYNFDTIQSFGIWKYYSRELRNWQKKYKDTNLEYNTFHIKTNIAITLMQTAVTVSAFAYCLYRLWTGQILYGDMTFFMQQRSALSSNFNTLVSTIPGMLNSSISAHRIREIVDLPKEEHDETAYRAVKELSTGGLSIEMDEVYYSYVENKTVYENAHFEAHPNEIVAVLGESGGGKTTLFRLLLAMVNPDSGKVKLTTSAEKEFVMNADFRKLISYVPQGNSIILGTIAENMRMVKSKATDDEIINALKLACAWDFVEPLGINSQLSERGKGISEGQAQRLSIARAILRDAPILLLDEATSALDETTESMVLDNIMNHCANRTVIVSTHRPAVLKKCRRVYKIKDKKIMEV